MAWVCIDDLVELNVKKTRVWQLLISKMSCTETNYRLCNWQSVYIHLLLRYNTNNHLGLFLFRFNYSVSLLKIVTFLVGIIEIRRLFQFCVSAGSLISRESRSLVDWLYNFISSTFAVMLVSVIMNVTLFRLWSSMYSPWTFSNLD